MSCKMGGLFGGGNKWEGVGCKERVTMIKVLHMHI
jgi:hypothetical protein